tara:strand:+ start:1576 stop:1923 length:348 start_codon:yes stop_codon:yes gene_type:complete
MTPELSVITCFNKYFDFSGRATRAEYWWFYLFQILVTLLPFMLLAVLGLEKLSAFWYMTCSVIFFLPALMVSIRRLHDINKSGFYLLLLLIPLIGPLIILYFLVLPSDDRKNYYD